MRQPRPLSLMIVRQLMRPGFPIVVLLTFLAIATGLKMGLDSAEDTQIQQTLAAETNDLARQLEQDFLNHVLALRRMAERREARPDMPVEVWRRDARQYLEDFRTFQAIEWIDQSFTIRWLEPMEGNEGVLGYNVAFSDARRKALEEAQETGEPDISGVIELEQGGTGLVVYAPIGEGNQSNGFIAGVFRMERLADALVLPRIRDRFSLALIEDGSVAFSLLSDQPTADRFSYTSALDLPSVTWSLRATPTLPWMNRYRSIWPWVTFISMVALGILVSLSILLAQLILKRNQDLLRTRRELEAEIDQRVAVQQDLARLESTDALTGLANRRFFMEDLEHTLTQADRKMQQVALIMMDLDRFQTLNDSLGHQFGDELLIRVSQRLNRLSDERVMVAYSGGDEFMICQQHVGNIDDVIHLLGQIKSCFARPFQVHGEPHSITATMGVAVYPQSGLDADILLRNADIALYRAKERGRNTYQFYTEGMQDREVRRLELDKDLSEALAGDQFELHYQPQLDLITSRACSVEALIRWNHPQRGMVPPVEFIPLAEESGRIAEIGRWVIQAACRQLRAWQNTNLSHLRIAINLSGRELDQPDLPDYIGQCLLDSGVAPHQLEIELTEESFIANIEHNHEQLRRISELGVHLAIDDFGVGYSSLGYLRNFPVDLLKIDRSFITNVAQQQDDAVITRAIINLAHNLGIRVVAEGVETKEQLRFLYNHQCDLAQGYLVGRPMPARKLAEKLTQGLLPESLKHNS
ncbi:diguanylate cyclase (GGDEF) domain-containing protein [Marinobacter daqiaonensis]|uniref:cyclic-guanylate-specific phosphodiesterase n=1 Tax=Marinobacter daqiaonensis TaxID=650891 RepID=A0A1I6I952_9GAMM|nr:EAL domain-containing protein [Marinobacter daqiaonensis]SFR63236.1 diguanylate cyclase (GGDEF) domain-containing protein [Marinobacter daqiaonensis]